MAGRTKEVQSKDNSLKTSWMSTTKTAERTATQRQTVGQKLEGGGQGLKAKPKLKKDFKIEESVVVAVAGDDESFAFICTTDQQILLPY